MAGKSAQKIGSVRGKKGMNQTEFWGRIGVAQESGSKYEHGKAMPTPVAILFNLVHGYSERQAQTVLTDLRK